MAVTQFTTVTVEGGLFPAELLARLAHHPDTVPGTRPEDYRLTPGKKLREVINRSWNDLIGAWTTFRTQVDRVPADDHSAQLTWDRWLLPLLGELGWGRVPRRPDALDIEGKEYPVSHQDGNVVIHLLGWNTPLERRTPGVRGAATAAPHSLVQEVLNRSDDHVWAIVANGRRLRILRDNSSLTRAAYIEFDLEAMFDTEQFADFVLLWMLGHASRLDAEPQLECWLERWVSDAREQGVRALDHLRDGFEVAIKTLGAGFLAHRSNVALRQRLQQTPDADQEYYRQILRVVYRLVFLLVAEDRELLHPPGATREVKDRYLRFYSLSRLRDLARRRRGTTHSDQWEQVKVVMTALHRTGLDAVGIPALGSALWDPDATPDLATARLSNAHLLAALRALSYTQQQQALHRIDYRNLGSEELGSIYESLLELRPRIHANAEAFDLTSLSGSERKTTGSYYTPTALISALLDVSLDRLLDEAEQMDDPERALLQLRVIDPAVGSGHFIVAAAQRIANRLAIVRTGETNASPEATREALRDVIAHCVYGIDVNPMAVELCKVSLWLEAVEPGKPLSFLDHHIVCGNGLIGATPRLLAAGVPDEAFTAIEGDDKPTATARRKTNAHQRINSAQGTLDFTWSPSALAAPIAAEMAAIEALADDTTADIEEQARRYAELQRSAKAERARLAADAWCAAFVAVKDANHPAITDEHVRAAAVDPARVPPAVLAQVHELRQEYSFLHWHLAFPQVFTVDLDSEGEYGWTGGFDLVLGNPPWETMSPDRREWFGEQIVGIRGMPPDEQDDAIARLLEESTISEAFARYTRNLYGQVHFLKSSGRYTLYARGNLGKGDFNVYRMFVETALRCTRSDGYAAQVTPGGLYGGPNASAIRKHLLDHNRLEALFGLINTRRAWFPDVDIDRFAAYAARIGGVTTSFAAWFGLSAPAQVAAEPVTISADVIRSQAPETYAIPDARSSADLVIAAKMTAQHPVFGDPSAGPPYRDYQTEEIHMKKRADIFTTDVSALPLYEGRMVGHFDHRAKRWVSGHGQSAKWAETPFGDPTKGVKPQWRVHEVNVPSKLKGRHNRFRIGYGEVGNPRNERSLVAALIPPRSVCGHSVITILYPLEWEWAYLPWLAVANSLTMDYLVRSRLAGAHIGATFMDGLPFPRYAVDHPVVQQIAPLVLRLVCTSAELTPYWNAMSAFGWCEPTDAGTVPEAALVDPKSRFDARAEVDAIVARHVFGLTADELAHVLDQFPVLEKRDRKAFGDYVTKELVLDRYLDV